MKLKITSYKKEYIDPIALMMSQTWTFDQQLKDVPNRQYIYKCFFKMCHASSDYAEFVLSPEGKVLGCLLAGPTSKKFNPHSISLFLEALYGFSTGKFGNRRHLCKLSKHADAFYRSLLGNREQYDQEINLFFIDEAARGMGLGKLLMNRYMNYCKENDFSKVILLTDMGCNFGFYEHYGFERVTQAHTIFSPCQELEYNAFNYAYELKNT